jgi:predicted nucleotidyltransferase
MDTTEPRYSPLEQGIFREVVGALSDLPLRELAVFGSRARGRSHEGSDLDLLLILDMPRGREVERRLEALGRALSVEEATGHGLRVQLVPQFRGDEAGYLSQTIARERDPVWTPT